MVAHHTGGVVVVGSNPAIPTNDQLIELLITSDGLKLNFCLALILYSLSVFGFRPTLEGVFLKVKLPKLLILTPLLLELTITEKKVLTKKRLSF